MENGRQGQTLLPMHRFHYTPDYRENKQMRLFAEALVHFVFENSREWLYNKSYL